MVSPDPALSKLHATAWLRRTVDFRCAPHQRFPERMPGFTWDSALCTAATRLNLGFAAAMSSEFLCAAQKRPADPGRPDFGRRAAIKSQAFRHIPFENRQNLASFFIRDGIA